MEPVEGIQRHASEVEDGHHGEADAKLHPERLPGLFHIAHAQITLHGNLIRDHLDQEANAPANQQAPNRDPYMRVERCAEREFVSLRSYLQNMRQTSGNATN